MASLTAVARERYMSDKEPFFVDLVVKPHFDNLTDKEKRYSHFISKGAHAGTAVVLRSVSPESLDLYKTIIAIHRNCNGDYSTLRSKADGLNDEDVSQYLAFAGQFLGNCGNYKSFGDSKIIPRLPQDKFDVIARTCRDADSHYQKCRDAVYSFDKLELGYPADGHMSNYYPDSPAISKAEVDDINALLVENELMPENTRVRKTADGYKLLVSSAGPDSHKERLDAKETNFSLSGPATKGKKLSIVFGDNAREMAIIAECMQEAAKYAANDNQKNMFDEYAVSFRSGSMEAHKQSQRYWIKDTGPAVESNIGFIETYRDPSGVRGEWEGFAAIVNKERTAVFSKLVDDAPSHLPRLPWPATFERDEFIRPDFTSLEVLTFAGSGIPAGINIPNYDDLRQNLGFKNVSLGNTLSAFDPNQPLPYLREEDKALFKEHRLNAWEVQVGIHELLGHGSGKLFQEVSKDKYNFDMDKRPVNPITNEPISSWYKLGETWGSKFGGLSPSYEECRAESVAMSLGCEYEVLHTFGFAGSEMNSQAGDLMYIMWLSMARAGLASLEWWDPASKKWGQAHSQARFAILKAMLSAGPEFCRLEYKEGQQEDGSVSNIFIHMDRTKIISHGRPAVDDLLTKLQIFKATADVQRGSELYLKLTNVDEFWASKIRPEVARQRQPRKVFVQANTVLTDSGVELKTYSADAKGMIESFADRTYIF